VSADWLANRYAHFGWDQRTLGLYKDFCKRHLAVVKGTEGNDYVNGGFYLYEIRRAPLARPPRTVWYLPGTEALWARYIGLESAKQYGDLVAHARELHALLPDVGHAWNELGHAYALAGDSASCYRYLKPYALEWMHDVINLPEFGTVAVRMGDLVSAQRYLEYSESRFPAQTQVVRVNLGLLRVFQAYNAVSGGRPAEGKRLVEEGEDYLAYELAPGERMAPRWREMAEELAPGTLAF
jgi:hypothetical protein